MSSIIIGGTSLTVKVVRKRILLCIELKIWAGIIVQQILSNFLRYLSFSLRLPGLYHSYQLPQVSYHQQVGFLILVDQRYCPSRQLRLFQLLYLIRQVFFFFLRVHLTIIGYTRFAGFSYRMSQGIIWRQKHRRVASINRIYGQVYSYKEQNLIIDASN